MTSSKKEMTPRTKRKRGAASQARQNKSSRQMQSGSSAAYDVMVPHDKLVRRDPELKHLDVNTSGYIGGVTYAGTITSLSDVVQGGAGNQRVGDALRIRGLDFRCSAYHQAGSVQGTLRFIVFVWNEDSTPTTALVLQGTGSAAAAVSPYNSDHVQNGSLNLLADFVYAGDSSPDAFYKHLVMTLDSQVTFTASSTSGAGKAWILVLSDAGLATNCANYQWWSRLIYSDD